MNIPCIPPSEQQLMRQFDTLKQELLNNSMVQMNSAFKFNSTMTLLFQNIQNLFSNYTKKIASLQKQNTMLRSKLPRQESKNSMLLDYISTESINFDQNDDEDDEFELNGGWNNQGESQPKGETLLKRQNQDIEQYRPFEKQFPNIQQKSVNIIKKSVVTQSKPNVNYTTAFTNMIKNPTNQIQVKPKSNPPETKIISKSIADSKKKDRAILRQQFLAVSIFTKDNLSKRLQYNQNHTANFIPKKHILKEYFVWCSQNKRNVLRDKGSTIQMALTNELKILFPMMDSYTKNYRGLKFIDNTSRVYSNSSQNEEIDSLNGQKKNQKA